MEDNRDTTPYLNESTTDADSRPETITASVGPPLVKPLWPGALLWLMLCAGYIAFAMSGFGADLWLAPLLMLIIVLAQTIEATIWVRRVIGIATTLLVLFTICLSSLFMVWKHALPLRKDIHAETIVLCVFIGSSLILPCLLRGVRARLFPVVGLNPNSSLHTTVAVLFVVILMLARWLSDLLSDLAGVTVILGLKDPLISLLTDVPLALVGVGFLMRRDFKQSLIRLGFVPITIMDFVQAAIVTVPLLVAVIFFEYAEAVFLPEIHELDKRFSLEFVNLPPFIGLSALSLAAGVGEEAIFRGALQPRFGIFLTSLLFAALHVQYQLPGTIVIFFIGIMLGIMRNWKSTTFTASVHVVYDIIAFSLPDF